MKKFIIPLILFTMIGSMLFAINPVLAQGGGIHSLVLTSDNQLYAWGNNYWGNLGDNSTTDRKVPTPVYTDGVLAGKTIVKVAKGDYFVLALDDENHLYTWGNNTNGSLGNNSSADHSQVPVEVDMTGVLAGKTITDIAAGAYHALVLDSDGKLYAWGDNYRGQLGNYSNTDAPLPIEVYMDGSLSGKTITALAAGQEFSMVLDSNGKIYTWGHNNEGQLGINSYVDCNYPVPVYDAGYLNGKIITSICASNEHALALDSEGQAYAWGNNQYGQLGDGSNSDRRIPVKVYMNGIDTEGQYLTAISGGRSHSAAIDSDGKIYTWGQNWNGALGINSDIAYSDEPVSVYTDGILSGKTFVQVSAMYSCTFAMDSEGNLYSWGYNSWGLLGDNTLTTRDLPVSVVNNDYSQFNMGTPEAPCPITLASFTAKAKNGNVELSWETASETNNARFVIYRNNVAIGSVEGAGTCSEPHHYVFTDKAVVPGMTYTYVLADVDYANKLTKHEAKAVTVANDLLEADFMISSAFPNPFNPSVTISYELSSRRHVQASIYNIHGEFICSLLDSDKTAGTHELVWNAANMPSGVYILKMLAGDLVNTKKLVLMK